jgi:hypothetical protein
VSDDPQGPGWWRASDGRWYPPQAAPPSWPPGGPPGAPYTPPPPAKTNRGCLIALAIVGVLAVLGIAAVVVVVLAVEDEVDERVDVDDGVRSFSGNTENPPEDDVTLGECDTDPTTRFMQASLEVTNHSSEPSNYIMTVAFEAEDGGRQITTGSAVIDGLRPDQSTTVEASALQEAPGGQDFSCRISQVERFAA